MKTRIVLSVLLVLAAIVFYFSKPGAKENSVESVSGTHPEKFYIGFIDMGRQRNFSFLSELNFNLWHTLLPDTVSGGKSVSNGWVKFGAPGDTLFAPLENYESQVGTILSTNSGNNYKSFTARPKLEMLTFAQRSDYQLEYVTPLTQDTVEWWYAFDTSDFSSSYDAQDSNVIVKHLTLGLNPGYIAKSLRAHMEQVGVGSPNELYCDTNYSWYIKPRMRIDSSFANNPANVNKKVCRIDVFNYDGDTVRKVDIKVSNFLNSENNFYDGSYKDEFRFDDNPRKLIIDTGRVLNPRQIFGSDSCKFDIQVYWYAECEIWIDYIRVENDWAERLFSGYYEQPGREWIKWEADEIATLDNTYNFYTDESEYNMMPAIKYINERIHQYKPSLSINSLINITFTTPALTNNYFNMYNNYSVACPLPPSKIKSNIRRWGMNMIMIEDYPLYSNGHSWDFFRLWQTLPNTLPISGYNVAEGVLGIPVSPSVYENNLDSIINKLYFPYLKIAKDAASELQLPIHLLMQSFLSYNKTETAYAWREPTNQELNLMANLALTYNVKAISHFIYGSWGVMESGGDYTRGALGRGTANVNYDTTRRDYNAYGQNKWAALCSLNVHINKLGDYLVSFNESQSRTYNYRDQSERNNLASQSYFINAVTFIRGGGATPQCGNPDYVPSHPDLTPDCQDSTYLQIATFQNPNEANKHYFMVVNRRCSPVNANDSVGGKRYVCVTFQPDETSFPGAYLWSIINLENGVEVGQFDRRYYRTVNLSNDNDTNNGWFKPGEGRLYHIVPKFETGGTLGGDEYVNCSVTCKKSIYNNGYNITLGTNANISFEDSAGIYMSGGNLKIGNENQTPGSNLQIKGTSSNKKWQGFILENCDTVLVYGATFSNLLPNQPAISFTNCFHYRIEGNSFNCTSGENSNGVYVYYSTDTNSSEGDFHYIRSNSFSFNGNTNPAVQVIANAVMVVPAIISYNTFNTGAGSSSSTGILLTNISGGVLQGNNITNYLSGITLLSSTADFFDNNIASNVNSSRGIQLILSESGEAPAKSQGFFTGGCNYFTVSGSASNNIYVEDSHFDIDEGYNTFDIDFSNSVRHISGYFPSTAETDYNATYNCFTNKSEEDTASIFVTQGSGGVRINFITDPTYCASYNNEDFVLFNLPGGINDTMYLMGEGSGGAFNEQLPITNVQLQEQKIKNFYSALQSFKTIFYFPFSIFNIPFSILHFPFSQSLQTQTNYKILKDSININVRKHYYNLVEIECKEMLMYYPDSSESIGAISKLYLSALSLDNSGNHIQSVKTFFETLILNNPNNTPLIKRANYFVQKCKVALKQYTSALQGFQEIINQNPYSYEGLIASWDYAATTLLANSSGGALNKEYLYNNSPIETMNSETSNVKENEIKNISRFTSHVSQDIETILDSLKSKKPAINSYTTEIYDQKKFTKQDRAVINTTVENAFKNERTKQIEKLKELETKILSSTSTSKQNNSKYNNNSSDAVILEAKRELKTMKSLGEVVKAKNPKNIIEHINIVNTDIKKVFGNEKLEGSKKLNSSIPTEYNLSQNYPNPFNPVTKINYELPKDGKVKLVIYDILGREIKTLVNELKQAGRYTIEFNGNNYASGVYFYRIQVEGGKSYTAVKKMVLIK